MLLEIMSFNYYSLNLLTDIMKLKTLKGLALQDILTEVHLYVHRGKLVQQYRSYLTYNVI